jgi:hypothetical protein
MISGCAAGSNSLLPTMDCLGFYYCVSGTPSGSIQCPAGTIFDVGIQTCNWSYAVNCQCSGGSPTTPTSPTPPAPTPPAPTPTSPTSQQICHACPVSNWDMIGAKDCSGFYHCISGSPQEFIACPQGTIWSQPIKGCDYPWRATCTCTA